MLAGRVDGAQGRGARARGRCCAVRSRTPAILAANARDLAAAEERGSSPAMLDRLRLDAARLDGDRGRGRARVAALPDPVGESCSMRAPAQRARGRAHARSRSASSPSSTRRGPTSPPTPPRSASRPATRASCAAAPRRFDSNRALRAACSPTGSPPRACPPPAVQLVPTTDREATRARSIVEGD